MPIHVNQHIYIIKLSKCEQKPLKYIYLFSRNNHFVKYERKAQKARDLDNLVIYQPFMIDIICRFSISFPQYTRVFFEINPGRTQ